jgi:hypothetical protein
MRKRKNDFEIGELVDAFMQQPAYKEKLFAAKIKLFWKDNMGTSISKSITSIDVRRGVLYLKSESSVVRQELLNSKTSIIAKMNEMLGEAYIQDVVLR